MSQLSSTSRVVDLQLNILAAKDDGLRKVGMVAQQAQRPVDRLNQAIRATTAAQEQLGQKATAGFSALTRGAEQATQRVRVLNAEIVRAAAAADRAAASGGGMAGFAGFVGRGLGGMAAQSLRGAGSAAVGFGAGQLLGPTASIGAGLAMPLLANPITGTVAGLLAISMGAGLFAEHQISGDQSAFSRIRENMGFEERLAGQQSRISDRRRAEAFQAARLFEQRRGAFGLADREFRLSQIQAGGDPVQQMTGLAEQEERIRERILGIQRELERSRQAEVTYGAQGVLSAAEQQALVKLQSEEEAKLLQIEEQRLILAHQMSQEAQRLKEQTAAQVEQIKRQAEALKETREDRLTSLREQFGELNPLERQRAIDLARRLRSGEELSSLELQTARQLAPLQGLLREVRGRQAAPLFEEFLKVGGLSDKIKREFDKLRDEELALRVQLPSDSEFEDAGRAIGKAIADALTRSGDLEEALKQYNESRRRHFR